MWSSWVVITKSFKKIVKQCQHNVFKIDMALTSIQYIRLTKFMKLQSVYYAETSDSESDSNV